MRLKKQKNFIYKAIRKLFMDKQLKEVIFTMLGFFTGVYISGRLFSLQGLQGLNYIIAAALVIGIIGIFAYIGFRISEKL